MKKIVKYIFVLSFIPLSVFAAKYDAFDDMKSAYSNLIPFYQNMYNCTPYVYKDWGGTIYQVYGKENNFCHIKQGSKNCYYPIDVSNKYAANSIIVSKKKISDLEKGKFNYSTDNYYESGYFTETDAKYCKYDLNH